MGTVIVIKCLAILIELQIVTERQTDRHTSIALVVKTVIIATITTLWKVNK